MSGAEALSIIHKLRARQPLQELVPSNVWDPLLSKEISACPLPSSPEGSALRSAMLLWNDDLFLSHELSQSIHTATGSLLHGMMHRMEGDYSNASYWFHRAGSGHPVYADITDAMESLEEVMTVFGPLGWDPERFNRAVEQAVRSGTASPISLDHLRRLQHTELEAVTIYCFHQVYGGKLLD